MTQGSEFYGRVPHLNISQGYDFSTWESVTSCTDCGAVLKWSNERQEWSGCLCWVDKATNVLEN